MLRYWIQMSFTFQKASLTRNIWKQLLDSSGQLDLPKYACPLNDIGLNKLNQLIDSTKVKMDSIKSQFTLAKNFVMFTINNHDRDFYPFFKFCCSSSSSAYII